MMPDRTVNGASTEKCWRWLVRDACYYCSDKSCNLCCAPSLLCWGMLWSTNMLAMTYLCGSITGRCWAWSSSTNNLAVTYVWRGYGKLGWIVTILSKKIRRGCRALSATQRRKKNGHNTTLLAVWTRVLGLFGGNKNGRNPNFELSCCASSRSFGVYAIIDQYAARWLIIYNII